MFSCCGWCLGLLGPVRRQSWDTCAPSLYRITHTHSHTPRCVCVSGSGCWMPPVHTDPSGSSPVPRVPLAFTLLCVQVPCLTVANMKASGPPWYTYWSACLSRNQPSPVGPNLLFKLPSSTNLYSSYLDCLLFVKGKEAEEEKFRQRNDDNSWALAILMQFEIHFRRFNFLCLYVAKTLLTVGICLQAVLFNKTFF